MKKNNIVTLLLLVAYTTLSAQYTSYVNPFIGTGGHGHTFPGAVVPFGMVALSPDTRIDGSWDGCSGYHFDDSIIYGFSHTHLSGTGCSDLGDIAFLPIFNKGSGFNIFSTFDDTLSVGFHHDNEMAVPGYYGVMLDDSVTIELTSTTRVGFQRYRFGKVGEAWVVLNLQHRDKLLEGRIVKTNNRTYKGLRRSKAWATDQLVYYYFELSEDPEESFITKDDKGNDSKLYMKFTIRSPKNILIKTGISSVSEEGAALNLTTEIPHWDFEKTRKEADVLWNKELSCIDILSNKEKVAGLSMFINRNLSNSPKLVFYTALYHCFIHPSIYNDVDHQYRGRDGLVHKAEGFDYYTVFSLWDTYRALHPLFNIVQRKRNSDFIKTFLAQYYQVGRLPVWELWGNETNCMIGYHAA
ncbi:MAG: glycoside hydrolase family 92 protein, partial [Bacteroidetes bacterium]|nr:glycoside hydrolase family 92 protein [Bacteroidota bacterium]